MDSTMTFSYDETAGATFMTDNRQNQLTHYWDENGRLVKEVDGLANATERGYDGAGLLEWIKNPRGFITSLDYDANGNLTLARDSEGHEIEAGYDLATNNLLWTEDASGARTTFSYDPTDTLLLSIVDPVRTRLFDYYPNGLVHHERSAGATTTFEYTASGQISRIIDPLGNGMCFGYDGAGNMIASSDAESRTVGFAYDNVGHLLAVTDPTSATASFAYDTNGNLQTATDARGNTSTYGYDAMDLLASVVDELDNTWAYTYDANYNLKTVTNPRGKTRTYDFDAADRLTSVEDALGHTTELTYTAHKLTQTEYATGKTVSRTYWDDDLLKTLTLDDEGQTWSFGYTPTHWISSVENNAGIGYEYGYNPIGWLTTATDTVNPDTAGGFVTSYDYDDAGRTTKIKASDEGTRTYVYSLRGDLDSLELPSDPAGVHTDYMYDKTGLVTEMSLPDGSEVSYRYDNAGRIESVAATTGASDVYSFEYQHDASGNVTDVNGTRYGYDELNRLVTWYDPSTETTTTYAYDGAYNLTQVSTGATVTASFTFDEADRITNTGFAYDDAGNMTCDGKFNYIYDSMNRLVEVRLPGESTTIAGYAYDHINRRVSSTVGTETTYLHYDGDSATVIAETGEDGETIATYAYDAMGRLHSMTRGGQTFYYHLNAHGDVVALTDVDGVIVNEYAYDPYGVSIAATEIVDNPYRYAGYRFDTETGHYCCSTRYYDPATCRFLTLDRNPGEITMPATTNGYAYCLGDPVNMVDPDGQSAALAAVALVAGVICVITGYSLWQKISNAKDVECDRQSGALYEEFGMWAKKFNPEVCRMLQQNAQEVYQMDWEALTPEQKKRAFEEGENGPLLLYEMQRFAVEDTQGIWEEY